jgi:uncharacterized protein involved in exopolysaccharide biosynthesis
MSDSNRRHSLAPLESAAELDGARVRELLGLIWRAPRRHPALAMGVLAVNLLATLVYALWLPRSYEVDARIVGQRVLVMPSLGNPHRSVPTDADAPTRGAVDAILDQENVVSLVKDTNLLDRWEANRPKLMRWKDKAVRLVTPKPTEEDRLRSMIGLVKKRLMVQADESTIKITLQWDDPAVAYDVVDLAQRNFLQRRSAMETAVIVDTITILEAEARTAREALAVALADAARLAAKNNAARMGVGEKPEKGEKADGAATPGSAAGAPTMRTVTVVRPTLNDSTTAEHVANASGLAKELDDKRAEIRAVEGPWQRNLADLRAKLADLRATYAEAHPAVMTLERRIADASAEPKELVQLRADEKALLAQIDSIPSGGAAKGKVTTTTISVPVNTPASALSPGATQGEGTVLLRDEPPELTEARTKLQAASRKYEERADRIDAARIELETARAAFKYRYRVVLPPELPKEPLGPGKPARLAGGAFLSLLVVFFAAGARDLLSGCLVEGWQARRRLRVPLLSEVVEP